MSVSLVDAIRINNTTWGWSSVAISIDGMSTESITGIDYEEQLEVRIIPSNIQDQLPLGMSAGRYQVGKFPLRMLRDAGLALKQYLTTRAPLARSGSYGQATFDLGLQLSGFDAALPSTVVFTSCRIVGERASHEEGTGALVTEFTIACLAITQDGTSLFDATGFASALLPGTDTITIAGLPAPGKWTLQPGGIVFGWEKRKGTALSGATVVPVGDELAEAKFLVEIWTPADYALFQAFRALYLKKALATVAGAPVGLAIGIAHPELTALGVSAFVPAKVGWLTQDGFGVWSAEVEFLQYRPPVPALSKPDASIPDISSPTPSAQTQTEIEIQKATAQLKALAP